MTFSGYKNQRRKKCRQGGTRKKSQGKEQIQGRIRHRDIERDQKKRREEGPVAEKWAENNDKEKQNQRKLGSSQPAAPGPLPS